jgi:hypothetical protein
VTRDEKPKLLTIRGPLRETRNCYERCTCAITTYLQNIDNSSASAVKGSRSPPGARKDKSRFPTHLTQKVRITNSQSSGLIQASMA